MEVKSLITKNIENRYDGRNNADGLRACTPPGNRKRGSGKLRIMIERNLKVGNWNDDHLVANNL